jgi:hypothetical protein
MPLPQELLDEIEESGRSQITLALVRVKHILNSQRYSDEQKAQAQEYADALQARLEAIQVEETDASLAAELASVVTTINQAD